MRRSFSSCRRSTGEYGRARNEKPNAVAAVMFRIVHGLVGVAESGIRFASIERIGCDADAGRQMQLHRFDVVGLGSRTETTLIG